MEERACLSCGKPVYGRLDKKFCDDQCRNDFNNKQNSDTNKRIRNINNILRKNRRILEKLNPNGKSKVHRDKLSKLGYDFEYFTNMLKTKTGNTYYFCYEQGYLELDHKMFALVLRNYE